MPMLGAEPSVAGRSLIALAISLRGFVYDLGHDRIPHTPAMTEASNDAHSEDRQMQNDRTLTDEELFCVVGGAAAGGHGTGGGKGTGGGTGKGDGLGGRANMTMADWINWFVYQGTPH